MKTLTVKVSKDGLGKYSLTLNSETLTSGSPDLATAILDSFAYLKTSGIGIDRQEIERRLLLNPPVARSDDKDVSTSSFTVSVKPFILD